MKKIFYMFAALAAISFAACSDNDNEVPAMRHFDDQTAPTVVSVSPEDGSEELDTFDNVVITYSEPIAVTPNTTIRVYTNDTTYYYLDDTLSYAEGNKLYIPLHAKANQNYKIVVMKPTVRDSSYNFASEYTVSFSTRAYNNWNPELFDITPTLCNPDATEPTKNLYQYLVDNFGKKVITGTVANVNWNVELAEQMHDITGKYPALNCFDFIHFNNSKPLGNANWIDYTNTSVVEDWYNNNGIVECMWHWNVPASEETADDISSYTCSTDKTTFTCKQAVRNGTWENTRVKRDLEVVADYLLALQEKGIPVIWRPLHEARGNYGKWNGSGTAWFWWGSNGPVQFKKLWKLMYDTFKEKGVNNLIWVWTSEGYYQDDTDKTITNDAAWYPGDEYVDIIARDYYCKNLNTPYQSSLAQEYEELRKITGGKKLITLAECDAMPSVENMFNDGAMWSWSMPWYGQDADGVDYFNSVYNTATFLKNYYNNKNVITRDQVPSFK